MDQRPKCKVRNYKTLRGNISRALDLKQRRIFYDPPTRVKEIKAKISKQDLIKHKTFCKQKEAINGDRKDNPQDKRK